MEHPSPFWLQICIDIAKAMEHLHSLGFYHRDLHLQNFLFFLGNSSTPAMAKLAGTAHMWNNIHQTLEDL